MDDDAALVSRARAGDASAFEEIVRRHQRRVYAAARRIVRRHEEADDVTQEAFLKAWRALDRFELGRPFGPWVARIAVHVALDRVRSPRWHERPLPEDHDETPSAAPSPERALRDAEAAATLEEALGALPPEQRAVFALRTLEEMTCPEIARELGLPEGTVMSRLFRARDRLRALLGPRLRGERGAR